MIITDPSAETVRRVLKPVGETCAKCISLSAATLNGEPPRRGHADCDCVITPIRIDQPIADWANRILVMMLTAALKAAEDPDPKHDELYWLRRDPSGLVSDRVPTAGGNGNDGGDEPPTTSTYADPDDPDDEIRFGDLVMPAKRSEIVRPTFDDATVVLFGATPIEELIERYGSLQAAKALGHSSHGYHHYTVARKAGKSPFPENWNESEILNWLASIIANPTSGQVNPNGAFELFGEYDGVYGKVIVRRVNGVWMPVTWHPVRRPKQ